MGLNDEYCLSSGTFQKLCHTTRETLRYYEKAGVLVPEKDPANGYKYYSHAQIATLYYIKALTDIGPSLAEIKYAVMGGNAGGSMHQVHKVSGAVNKSSQHLTPAEPAQPTHGDFSDFIDDIYMNMLKKREELDRKITLVRTLSYLTNRTIWMKPGVPKINETSLAARILVTGITSEHPYSSGEITKDITRHMDFCHASGAQAFPMGASISRENFLGKNYAYKNVFTLTLSDPDVISLHKESEPQHIDHMNHANFESNHPRVASTDPHVESNNPCKEQGHPDLEPEYQTIKKLNSREYFLPRGARIASVTASEESGKIDKIYQKLISAVKKEGLRFNSDIYSLSLINTVREADQKAYLKYIFAVVDQPK